MQYGNGINKEHRHVEYRSQTKAYYCHVRLRQLSREVKSKTSYKEAKACSIDREAWRGTSSDVQSR